MRWNPRAARGPRRVQVPRVSNPLASRLLLALLLALLLLGLGPYPGLGRGPAMAIAGGFVGRTPPGPRTKTCPVFLFGVTRRGRILQGRDLVKSASSSSAIACHLPDVRFKGHLFSAFAKPGLFKYSDFARVTLGCDHLFSSDRDVVDLSREIHSGLLQVDAPPRYRVKTRLMNYLRDIARRDGGVWVLGHFGREGCRPRRWPADPADVEARVSRSPVLAVRPHGSDDIGPYVVPDENLDARLPVAPPPPAWPGAGAADSRIPLPPAEMDFPGPAGGVQ